MFNHFKVYNSVAVSILIILCKHYNHPSLDLFLLLKLQLSIHYNNFPFLPPFSPW